MRNITQKLRRILFGLIGIWSINGYAQSNVTSTLGIDIESDLLSTIQANVTSSLNTVRSGLSAVNGDCFIITASFVPTDFISSGETGVFEIALNNAMIFEIVVKNRKKWIIRRPTGIADNIDNDVSLDYEIYDDLGFSGTFTFIFGHYFTAIAVDDGSSYKLAPVFFGMDSNIGSFSSHMGEFTGEISAGYDRDFSVLKQSKIFRMSTVSAPKKDIETPNYSIAKLIQRLNDQRNSITNARFADVSEQEEVTQEEEWKTDWTVYPNPSKQVFNIDLTLEKSGVVSYEIFDLQGKSISKKEITLPKGNTSWKINEHGKLKSGMYLIDIVAPEFKETKRVILD